MASNLVILDHALSHHNLAELRDERTPPPRFRALVHRITLILAAYATRDLATRGSVVQTPNESMEGRRLDGAAPLVVPILRAGLGMMDAMLELLPEAVVGHVGVYRDEETLEPVEYLVRLPAEIQGRRAFILDPMLATGGSASRVVELLTEQGCTQMDLLCIVAAPEGVAKLGNQHPNVRVFTTALDRQLSSIGFILPGLGDAGDRLYGTPQG
ncbi:MAG: uracil phosphoribosyltransferase [Gemmatimonadota bacterium]